MVEAGQSWNHLEKHVFLGVGQYDIPEIQPERYVEVDWVQFHEANSTKNRHGKGVHFFEDDPAFERVWTNLTKYTKMLSTFDAVLSPDWSMYTDWPVAACIWNHYRKHYVAAYLQKFLNVRVYPTICWSDESSFDWCFDGEPVKSCVAVSSVGTQMAACDRKAFMLGYDAMLERLEPETILFYGLVPAECRGNIVRIGDYKQWKNKGGE